MPFTLVPFSASRPKTRLASVLDDDERVAFAGAMLADVLTAVRGAGGDPTVLSTEPLPAAVTAAAGEALADVPVVVDDRPLTPAVNAALDRAEPTADDPAAVVMADLALAVPAAVDRLFATGGDVAVAPGRGGGTNALVVRTPAFRVDYHGASFRDHLDAAAAVGASAEVVDSFLLATDVDEPSDLAEVLLHGEGVSESWLRQRGFELAVGEGRVGVHRHEDSEERHD